MLIGRVTGRVVATVRAAGLSGQRFLLVQPLDEHQEPNGSTLVAADATGTAGPGDLVHYEGGREAAMALDPSFVPVDHAIVGIIDAVTLDPRGSGSGPDMMLARVIGTVVSTIQHPAFDGRRLLLVRRIGLDGKPAGGAVIAVDTVQAGPGQTVLILDEGNSARQVLEAPEAPIRTVIVGIVDDEATVRAT